MTPEQIRAAALASAVQLIAGGRSGMSLASLVDKFERYIREGGKAYD